MKWFPWKGWGSAIGPWLEYAVSRSGFPWQETEGPDWGTLNAWALLTLLGVPFANCLDRELF